MLIRIAPALALAAVAACARAQTVDFRLVQLDPANCMPRAARAHTPLEPTQNYAVQARVNGGSLGGFVFDIVMPGEPDSAGTLAKLRIQDAQSKYYQGPATTSAASARVGMAYQFGYLIGISSTFNGLINTSGGSFTNSASQQEIGNMTGDAVGGQLLTTPGLDPLREGNPATWPNYGLGLTPVNYETAPLASDLAGPYFAKDRFVDVYRFRYTIGVTTPRTLTFTLNRHGAQTFSQFIYNSGQWGAQSTLLPATSVTLTPLVVEVEATGACCAGAHCTIDSPSGCGAAGGSYQGAGVVCGPVGNPTTCCRANFDGINGVQVQDIFDYLNAWFAGDGRADTNGGGLQVQDIFDFLNLWFAGCA